MAVLGMVQGQGHWCSCSNPSNTHPEGGCLWQEVRDWKWYSFLLGHSKGNWLREEVCCWNWEMLTLRQQLWTGNRNTVTSIFGLRRQRRDNHEQCFFKTGIIYFFMFVCFLSAKHKQVAVKWLTVFSIKNKIGCTHMSKLFDVTYNYKKNL